MFPGSLFNNATMKNDLPVRIAIFGVIYREDAIQPHSDKPLEGLRIKQAANKTQTHPFRNGLLSVRHALFLFKKQGGAPISLSYF